MKFSPGHQVERLTILREETPHPDWRRVRYRCRCSCGNEHVVSGKMIYYRRSKSCGCLRRETSRARLTRQHREGRMRHTKACRTGQENGAPCTCRHTP